MFNPITINKNISKNVLFLIAEFVFLSVSSFVVFHLVPRSSYFWKDGFGFFVYGVANHFDFLFSSPSLVMIFIFFNLLALWLGLIKKTSKLIIKITYMELVGIMLLIPAVLIAESESFLFLLLAIILPAFILFLINTFFISKESIKPIIRILFLSILTFVIIIFMLLVVTILSFAGIIV